MQINTKCVELPEISVELSQVAEVPYKSSELPDILVSFTKSRIHNKMCIEIKSVNMEPS